MCKDLFPGLNVVRHQNNCSPRKFMNWNTKKLLLANLTSDVLINVEMPEESGPYDNHIKLSYGEPPTIIELDLSKGHLVYVPNEAVDDTEIEALRAIGAIAQESEI